jgi:cell wall-associated NlpC family hydrolase
MPCSPKLRSPHVWCCAVLVLAWRAACADELSELASEFDPGAAVLGEPALPQQAQASSSGSLTTLQAASSAAHQLVDSALNLIGVRYRRGGESPSTGLDCSGLVRYVYRDAAGLDLPHRAAEISRMGIRIARDQLRPGDLIFFGTLRRTVSHVGIYIGDGQFIHAPATGGNVRIESLELAYWTKRFNDARRIEQ